jgi:hypothetical protein
MMFDQIVLGLSGLNVILSAVLLVIFLRNYKMIKSTLLLGMIFFASAFLLENLLSLYFYNSLLIIGINFITTFHLVVKFFESVGLLFILYVSWK